MVMTRAPEPDLGAFTGVKLLRMVATALVDLSRRSRLPDPIYSDKVQKAYNHLVVQCLRHRVDPPPSVPDMARWAATRRLAEWPLDLPADAESLDEFLVDPVTKVPTQRCYEWEVAGPDAAAELFENEIIRQVFVQCETAKSPQAYTAFRYLLVNRPVLTGLEMASDIVVELLARRRTDDALRCLEDLTAEERHRLTDWATQQAGRLGIPPQYADPTALLGPGFP